MLLVKPGEGETEEREESWKRREKLGHELDKERDKRDDCVGGKVLEDAKARLVLVKLDMFESKSFDKRNDGICRDWKIVINIE